MNPYGIPKGTGFRAFRHACKRLSHRSGPTTHERTNNRYGKSAPPLRQRARQAHINVSDLAMGEAISCTNRKVDQVWTKLRANFSSSN